MLTENGAITALSGIQRMDMQMLYWIAEHLRCAFLDWLMPLVSALGNYGILWILLAVILICTKRYRFTGIALGLSLLLGLLTGNLLLKPMVGRLRPFEVDESIALLISPPQDASFPSGHTLASFEAASVLMARHRRTLGPPVLVLAFLIAFSRLYLQVHFPSDVFFGMLLGFVNALIGLLLTNRLAGGPRKEKNR